jgi:hypothetical protein
MSVNMMAASLRSLSTKSPKGNQTLLKNSAQGLHARRQAGPESLSHT